MPDPRNPMSGMPSPWGGGLAPGAQAIGETANYLPFGRKLNIANPRRPNPPHEFVPEFARALRTPIQQYHPLPYGVPGAGAAIPGQNFMNLLGRGLRTPVTGAYQNMPTTEPWYNPPPSPIPTAPTPIDTGPTPFTNPQPPTTFSGATIGQIPNVAWKALSPIAAKAMKRQPGVAGASDQAIGDVASALSGFSGSPAARYGRSLGWGGF